MVFDFASFISIEDCRMIIVVFGLPGSGKSFFAEKLAERINATYLSTDKIRNELNQEKDYSQFGKKKIYERMINQALAKVNQKDQVLDGTFYLKSLRELLEKQLGDEQVLFIEITAHESIIKKRVQMKRADSDADFEVYKQLQKEFEPMKEPHLQLSSSANDVEEMVNEAITYMKTEHDSA